MRTVSGTDAPIEAGQAVYWPPGGTRHRIELAVPEDGRLLLRVSLDGDWSGDHLFTSSGARGAFVDALGSGEISVTERRIPLTDVCTELGFAPSTSTAPADAQDKHPGRKPG